MGFTTIEQPEVCSSRVPSTSALKSISIQVIGNHAKRMLNTDVGIWLWAACT